MQEENLKKSDNKTENYVLSSVLLNKRVIGEIEKLFNFLNKVEKKIIYPEDNFISTFYKKIGFVDEFFIGNNQKEELIFIFFGNNYKSGEDLINNLKCYSEDIKMFRELDIEKKGFILYFIELIVEKKINIDNNYYDIFMQTKTDKQKLTGLCAFLVIEGLKILNIEIINLINSYNSFFDKYISFDKNYLQDEELELFKKHFYDFFNALFIDISLREDFVDKFNEIEERIENNIILD